MAEIVSMLADKHESPENETNIGEDKKSRPLDPPAPSGGTRISGNSPLTLDRLDSPAYMVNARFELEWANTKAQEQIFGQGVGRANDITQRNLFRLFFQGDRVSGLAGREEFLRFHLAIAKNRLPKAGLIGADLGAPDTDMGNLFGLFDDVAPAKRHGLLHTEVNLAGPGEADAWHTLYASFFREGIFFSFSPVENIRDSLLDLLSRRDVVIRDLLKKRRPYLTELGVLVADIQNSVKICTELPPEEYFELINDVWGAMEPMLRRYYATHGKHAGDGLVCYFFPQPDCNYALNALRCAQEMKETMRDISRSWQNRKNWVNELRLNIGVHEGQEWFGTYQTPTHVEFTVLGDTINMAGRLSDFARDGAIWGTKNLMGKLSAKERDTVRFGIKRLSETNEEILVPSTYSRVSNLIDLANPKHEKFMDISALPITEVLDVKLEETEDPLG
ncbi:MAG: adenylate/guanylate cyclase domain-containing protein [Rhodospirillales bacterium]|nr:adenylate/guanylate cyclase domain-containing protein [Rhodospirillales bacterium]